MTVQRYRHDTKQLPCRRCGVGIEVGIRTRKLPVHQDCAMKNVIDSIRQMTLKSGPVYDKWLESGGNKGRPKSGGTPLDQGN